MIVTGAAVLDTIKIGQSSEPAARTKQAFAPGRAKYREMLENMCNAAILLSLLFERACVHNQRRRKFL